MALFGEKYGDWVRMVEIDGVSRELCGGTHVPSTGEIGLFHLLSETSSASNVRRIEAVTGRGGIELFRKRTEQLRDLAACCACRRARGGARRWRRLAQRAKELRRRPRPDAGPRRRGGAGGRADELGGLRVVVQAVPATGAKALLQLSESVRQRLGDSAVVLGSADDGRVHLVANFAPAAVERGLKAGEVVSVAARVAGGGGGGRDTMAQAGGRDPEKLPDALAAARVEIERRLG